jgi:RNA polymerase sigma-70 factor (ECF subfamily)
MTGEASYQTLVEPHRAELLAHCYRMLGSAQDAEDALQDALTSAWRALPRFEGRSSVRSWLFKIATNACLKLIERRPKRVLPIDFGPAADPHDAPAEPLVESVWVDPYPDSRLGLDAAVAGPEARYELRESVELAFIAALQHLPPRQRAVLILRDVLGFTAVEVADTLDTTTTSVYSALQRAHRTIDERLPDQSQQATLTTLGDEHVRAIAGRYVRAWESGDVDAVVALLADDATITMPPRPTWYRGRDAVARFLRTYPLASENRSLLVPAGVNAQLAFGHYFRDAQTGQYVPHGINVLTLRGSRIADITTFLTPEDFVRLGLPAGPREAQSQMVSGEPSAGLEPATPSLPCQ